ncbi:MAG: gamma-glutamyltransferase [Gemmatimonadota bacterium]|nr:gamma-glutamyltransferase [Gemmatimonadota bacterium]
MRSNRGMVVSGSAIATEIGVRVLESGGNAVDAAVATALALAVVEPTMSGLGGRTQILVRTTSGQFHGVDGTTEVPRGAPTDPTSDEGAYGYHTIGIPGTVAALERALTAFGTRSFAELLTPVIALADTGFLLPNPEAERLARVADQLREFTGSARYFLKPDGSTYRGGERLVQADLANTLSALATGGAEAFYGGWIADTLAADLARHGGFVTTTDLSRYRAPWSRIVQGSYRGFDLVGTYLPASGATTIEALHLLEQFDLSDRAGGAEWAALLAQALLLSFEDRVADLGTPDEHAQVLASKEWAATRAVDIMDPAQREDPVVVSMAAASDESPYTTHLSVTDRDGMVVALTQSLGPTMGSKVAAPGLGFVYAATMGYLGGLQPGDRPFSSQSPLIVLHDGEPVLVLGAAGGRRILSAIVSVVSRWVDQQLSLPDAMAAPRLHPDVQAVHMEARDGTAWSPEDLTDLASYGFVVDVRTVASYFARIHGIEIDPVTGDHLGVADPRWNGTAGAPGGR